MFVAFHLSISFVVDVDLKPDLWNISLDLGLNLHGTVREFRECFGKSLYGCNLLLPIQDFTFFLLPQDIGFSTNEGVYLPVYSEYIKGS